MTNKIKIAYIGYGFVGKACESVFIENTESIIIDPAHPNANDISVLSNAEVEAVFVAINAPTLKDGSVDATSIYDVFRKLNYMKYSGLVILKSTLPPAIVDDLSTISKSFRYVYSPEFLREEHWRTDAANPNMLLLGGPPDNIADAIKLYRIYSILSDDVPCRGVDYKTASLIKYTINSYLAMKVVFMNQLKNLYQDLYSGTTDYSIVWDDFTEILQLDHRMGISHFMVPGPDGLPGYGGSCFPKDISAMIGFDKNSRMSLLQETVIVNTKLRLS